MVSVIMPTYNRSKIIERAIKSVLAQSYSDFELIIIDDGSTDNTKDVVSCYKDIRIRYHRFDENRGQSVARNVGIDEAKGDYIAFLDSDNEWDEHHLYGRVELLANLFDPVISYSRIQMITSDRDSYMFPDDLMIEEAEERDVMIHKMCISNQIDTNGVVVSKNCLEKYRFDVNMKALEDWDIFFRIIRDSSISIAFDPRVTVKHHIMNDSISTRNDYFMPSRINIFYKNIDLFDVKQFEEMDVDIRYLMESIEAEDGLKNLLNMPVSFGKAAANYFAYIFYRMCVHHLFMQNRIDELELNEASYRHIVDIEEVLKHLNLQTIAIYGYGNFGRKLYERLRYSDILVTDIIDENTEINFPDGVIVSSKIPHDCKADGIIVTVLNNGEAIAAELRKETDLSVYTLTRLED